MTFRIVSFPVRLSRPIDSLILGARAAVADLLRAKARTAATSAQSAGIDSYDAGRRFAMDWAAAQRASKLLKNVPPSLVQWAFRSVGIPREMPDAGYVEAGMGAVGIFDPRWLQPLPLNAMMLKCGGVNAVGTMPEGTNINMQEVAEVRIIVPSNGGDEYTAEIVLSDFRGNRESGDEPQDSDPVEPDMEREDA